MPNRCDLTNYIREAGEPAPAPCDVWRVVTYEMGEALDSLLADLVKAGWTICWKQVFPKYAIVTLIRPDIRCGQE